jgi:hypothetical protein
MRKIEISGRVAAFASALALASTGLTACGGSSTNTTHNSSSTARSGASSAVTASTPNTGGSAAPTPKALSSKARARLAERLRTLRSHAASSRPAVAPTAQQTAFRSALTHFADCLRGHGVKIPAPKSSGKGPLFSARGVNTNTPQYRAAVAKCRSVLVDALRQAARQAKRG